MLNYISFIFITFNSYKYISLLTLNKMLHNNKFRIKATLLVFKVPKSKIVITISLYFTFVRLRNPFNI